MGKRMSLGHQKFHSTLPWRILRPKSLPSTGSWFLSSGRKAGPKRKRSWRRLGHLRKWPFFAWNAFETQIQSKRLIRNGFTRPYQLKKVNYLILFLFHFIYVVLMAVNSFLLSQMHLNWMEKPRCLVELSVTPFSTCYAWAKWKLTRKLRLLCTHQ